MSRFANLDRLKTFHKTVTAAGTAEVLNAGFKVPDGITAVIKAKSSNTNDVFLGGSKADAESATEQFSLSAGQAVAVNISNLANVWLDATTNGEGVEILFETSVI